jgi:hypothetical protein
LLFDKKMSLFTDRHAPAIVKAFDFSGVGTLVDVDGGRGSFIIEILKTFPDVRGFLYDRPEVTPDATKCIERAGLSDRCDVATGSFLESVPESGDAYVFKHVFHDWDDGNVLKMLQNCRRVMDEGDTLFVVEGFVGHRLFGWDGFRRWCDVYQMMCLSGKERTLDEMHDLLSRAGFEMVSLTPTSIVAVSVLKTKAIKAPAIATSAATESTPTASI